MTETQRRIRAYKRALPELRERVVAVALLLAMSASMLASASFAWVTLSTSPEVTGMATTVAANGNLEIALASGDMWDENGSLKKAVEPEESKVGDSSAKEGNTIQGANTKWGNLVNISYGYGLDQIALRPALLSSYNLTSTPLSGAAYGQDGRVIDTNEKYEFASWGKDDNGIEKLLAGDKAAYGVRAVTSVTNDINSEESDTIKQSFLDEAESYYRKAADHYAQLVSDGTTGKPTPMELVEGTGQTCIEALKGLVAVFAQDAINQKLDSSAGYTSCSSYLPYVYRMMEELEVVLEYEGQALMTLANYQAFSKNETGYTTQTFTELSQFLNETPASLAKKNVKLDTFQGFKSNWNTLQYCKSGLKTWADKSSSQEVYWYDISTYVNPLVNIDTVKLGDRETGTQINGINSDNIVSLLGVSEGWIQAGALKEIEARLIPDNKAYRLNAAVSIKVTVSLKGISIPYTVNATVYTTAWGSAATYTNDIATTAGGESIVKGAATAKDTYGLALDLWVRTNYPNAVLTLEGAVEYETEHLTIDVPKLGENGAPVTDEAGNEVIESCYLYTTTVDGVEDVQVYQQNGKYYRASTREEVTTGDKVTPVEEKTAIGYHGENRIWEDWQTKLDAGLIAEDSTTQGAGSCFVFYADTPTEQQKIKEMLAAFTIVFMDEEGNVLGTAELDVENSIAVNGKVTVPMQMLTGTEFTDESGTTQTGIMQLTQNEATYITALVYLNGSQLQNENVLASGELTGQLNIQFGTSGTLVVKDDEELMGQYRTITAAVTVDGQTVTDTTTLNYSETGHKANVTLTVDGDQPDHITGFFLRKINSTQGTRTEEMQFEKQGDGTWTATTTLTNPGNYVFNTLLVDGVEYTLKEDNQPTITIQGLTMTATTNMTAAQVMTADSSYPVTVTASINAAYDVNQVNAQFFSTDNTRQFTAILTKDSSGNWVGTANITSSGTYSLKYVSVNGQVLDAGTQSQFTLYLGLSARVYKDGPYEDQWSTKDFTTVDLPMKVEILDNTKNAIANLTGVKLYYNNINDPAEMTWDDAKGYYTGTLQATKAGTFTFQKLELGTYGTLSTSLNAAPEFRAIPPEPPTYSDNNTAPTQTIIGGGTATIQIKTANADAATVWAVVEQNVNGKTQELVLKDYTKGTILNTRRFDLSSYGDGIYTLKALYFQNVYDADNNFYPEKDTATAENSYVIDVSGKGITADVVATLHSKVNYGSDTEATESGKTYTIGDRNSTPFMTTQTTAALTVELTDYLGRAVDGLSAVNWNFAAPTNMQGHGGYSYTGGNDLSDKSEGIKGEDGITFSCGSVDITKAGKYTTTLTATINGNTVTLWTATFDVYSKTPSVKVTGISPTGSVNTKITWESKWYGIKWGTSDPKSGSFEEYEATLYANAKQIVICWFVQPELTLSVSGIENADNATVVLPAGNEGADAVSFAFATDGAVTKSIGKTGTVKTTNPDVNAYYGHGTQTITTMTLQKDGVTYNVTLDNPLTITNPSSVNQLS